MNFIRYSTLVFVNSPAGKFLILRLPFTTSVSVSTFDMAKCDFRLITSTALSNSDPGYFGDNDHWTFINSVGGQNKFSAFFDPDSLASSFYGYTLPSTRSTFSLGSNNAIMSVGIPSTVSDSDLVGYAKSLIECNCGFFRYKLQKRCRL